MRSFTERLVVFCILAFSPIACAPTYGATASQKPRFAYVANNQDGTVSIFEIDHAMLRARDYVYEAGSSPLSLALTPSQKFLYVGGNGSPSLVAYAVNTE